MDDTNQDPMVDGDLAIELDKLPQDVKDQLLSILADHYDQSVALEAEFTAEINQILADGEAELDAIDKEAAEVVTNAQSGLEEEAQQEARDQIG